MTSATDASAAISAQPQFFKRLGLVVAALGVGVGMASVAILMSRTPVPPPPAAAAKQLYLAGMRAWAQRTPESLNAASDDFNAALRIDPRYPEAYVGLAKTYNLMRQYTSMPDVQAYPLARAAAEKALALNERLPEAHAALAFADFWGYWDEDAARLHFQRALALDDKSVTAHQWYATFLSEVGDHAGALRQIDTALAADPGSESVRADRGKLLIDAGRYDEGVSVLRAIEAADPRFQSPHHYLDMYFFLNGPDRDYLRELRALVDLSHDVGMANDLEVASAGEASGGRLGMLRALLATDLSGAGDNRSPAYSVAKIYGLLGDGPNAMAWLHKSLSRREPRFLDIRSDPAFASLRQSRAFQDLGAQIRPQ